MHLINGKINLLISGLKEELNQFEDQLKEACQQNFNEILNMLV